jgi:predicted nucleotidyltransferase
MRLSTNEINSIKEALSEIDRDAKVYLFGSRVDDHKKGGDIDLLVFSEKIELTEELAFKTKLWDKLGEQKIDIVIPEQYNTNFVNYIKEKAVLL